MRENRESDAGFLSRGNGRRGEKKRQSERGEVSYRNGRGRGGGRGGLAIQRGGKGSEKTGFVVTADDEEESDKGYTSFKELIDSDEADDDDDDEDEVEEEVRAESEKGRVSSQIPKSSPQESDSYLSESRFDQCPISPLSLKGIQNAGYEKMTMVQEATLPVILKGLIHLKWHQ
ncbi:hypothetical protein ACS0TY_019368 [Phlomoides rotata]